MMMSMDEAIPSSIEISEPLQNISQEYTYFLSKIHIHPHLIEYYLI